jgi:hypothetical protein
VSETINVYLVVYQDRHLFVDSVWSTLEAADARVLQLQQQDVEDLTVDYSFYWDVMTMPLDAVPDEDMT